MSEPLESLLLKLAFLLSVVIDQPQTDLSKYTSYIEDKQEVLATPEEAIEAISKDPDASKKRADLSLGFKQHDVWFFAKLYNRTEEQEFVLNFNFYNLEEIDIWLLNRNGLVRLPSQGHLYNIQNRSFFSRLSNVRLTVPSKEESYLIYKVKTRSPMQAGTRLQTVSAFVKAEAKENAVYWWVYGIMFGVGIFYGILGLVAGKKMIRLYVSYLASVLFLQFFLSGHAYTYLDLGLSRGSRYFHCATPIAAFFTSRFASRFLRLRFFQPFAFRLLIAFQIVSVALAGLLLLDYLQEGIILLQVFTSFLMCSLFIIALRAIRMGQDEARYFAVSFGVFFISSFVFIAKSLTLIPSGFVSAVALPLGNAAQVVLMGLALGDRYRRMDEEKAVILAQKEAVQARYNQEILTANNRLEQTVKDKTKDLRMLLENTDIGIFTISAGGIVDTEYSRHLEGILGREDIGGQRVQDIILKKPRIASEEQERIHLAILYALGSEAMFFEANQHLLPQSLDLSADPHDKHLELNWTPILGEDHKVAKILVSLRDVTEILQIRRRAQETERRYRYIAELLEIGAERFSVFRSGIKVSLDRVAHDFRVLVSAAVLERSVLLEILRELHTAKALSRVYHLADFIEALHQAEQSLSGPGSPSSKELAKFEQLMAEVHEILKLYDETATKLFASLETDSETEDSPPMGLFELIAHLEPLVAEAARSQEKKAPELINQIPPEFRITSQLHRALMRALPHIISNCLDHGIEKASVRLRKGKSERGQIRFAVDAKGRLKLSDDGQGLALAKLEQKARERGLMNLSREELLELLFEQGFSTKDQVDHNSGRGVGMNAARAILREIGGDLSIEIREENDGTLAMSFCMDLGPGLLQGERALSA